MRRTVYRVVSDQNREFLISQDCLPVFVQQNKDCMNFQIVTGGSVVLKVDNSIITDYTGIEAELANSLIGLGDTLKLYKITQEVLSLETYWVYSTSQEQAVRDFSDWSIFEPIEISLVA